MILRGREQCLPQQSAAGRLFHRCCGVPDLGLQLRAHHAWRALRRLPPPARVLDYGCGSGRFTLFLARKWPHCAITGYEPDPATLAAARARHAAAGFTNIAFTAACPAGQFDLVLLLDVIAHAADAEQLGRQAAAALRPGGHLVLHTPSGGAQAHCARHRDFDREQTDRSKAFWTRAELAAWLARHGLAAQEWRVTFRRWAGGLAWELDRVTGAPGLTPLWYALARLDPFVPTRGGGLLLVARKDSQ